MTFLYRTFSASFSTRYSEGVSSRCGSVPRRPRSAVVPQPSSVRPNKRAKDRLRRIVVILVRWYLFSRTQYDEEGSFPYYPDDSSQCRDLGCNRELLDHRAVR